MKRVISLILVLAMLGGVMPVRAAAEEQPETQQTVSLEETTGQTVSQEETTEQTVPQQETTEETAAPDERTWEDFRYTLLADGSACILGFDGTPEKKDEPFLLEVPESIQGAAVTEISEGAFAGNDTINALLLPKTLETVGSGALEGCENLKVIAFRGEEPSFGESLAKDCDSLEEIFLLKDRDFSALTALLEKDLGEEASRKAEYRSFENADALEAAFDALAVVPEPAPSDETADTPESQDPVLRDTITAASTLASGTCGANLTWVLDSNGTLTISGAGDMDSYDLEDDSIPWYDIKEKVVQVTICSGVTSIGDSAFNLCTNLNSVVIPNSVKYIGDSVFSGCTSLTNVTIPNSVTSIGMYAFLDCTALTNVSIPNSVTSISSGTFKGCISLISVTIPNSVTSIHLGAFSGCTSLTNVTIPDSVTSISGVAFYHCTSLTRVTIPNSVTSLGNTVFYACTSLAEATISNGISSIGENLFSSCVNLTSVTIPDSVTSVGESAFDNCDQLTDVYYSGTEEQWGQIAIGVYNDPLSNATIHYNSQAEEAVPAVEASFDGHKYALYDLSMTWTEAKKYCQKLGGHLVTITSAEEQAFLESILPDPCTKREYWLGASYENGAWSWVTGETFDYSNWDKNQPDHRSGENYLEIFNCSGDGGAYPATRYKWNDITHDNISGSNPVVGADAIGFICEYEVTDSRITPYLSSNPILVNATGQVYAYYICESEVSVSYTIDGQASSTDSDTNGMIQIPLGSFYQPGEYTISVVFTKMGDENLIPEIHFQEKVKVTPLSFKQEWKASMSADASKKLSAGASIELPLIEAEATLGKVEGKAGVGNSINVSREFTESKETLEITSEKEVSGNVGVKSGITGNVLQVKFSPVQASAGFGGSCSATYGIKIEDYSADNSAQQRAIATYLLGEALMSNPNNLLYKPFHEFLSKSVYTASGCDVINGSSSGISVPAGADLAGVKINDTDLFSTASVNVKAAISMSESSSTSGEKSKTSSYKLNTTLAAVSGTLLGNQIGEVEGSILSRDFLGMDVKVTAKTDAENNKSVETSSLSSSVTKPQVLILGKHSTNNYNKYTFHDSSLNGLLTNTSSFDSYLNGSRMVLNQKDLVELAKVLSTSDAPIPYSSQTKDQVLITIPLKIGASLGVGATLGVDLSYLEGTSYTNARGFAVDDQLLLTSVSSDLSSQVDDNDWELSEVFTNSMKSLANDAANFFKKITGSIKDGVQDAWSWITKKADSTKNWIVSITSASDSDVWAESYSIQTNTLDGTNTALSDGITSEDSANYELTKAATIGRPFFVSVTDEEGNSITDLSEEPLEYTIRYAEADLQAAGLSRYSSVVRSGGIAMYRYSDDGDFFEYVGGINDLDAMTVTATIVKTGQYILAADSCAPELSNLDISDFHANPTITAKMTDLTGLDLDSFRFVLDGQCVVDGTSAAAYFNKATGVFTYTVPENAPLSEGEHTMAFTLSDTTGNSETYSFTFPVDLTAPVITQYSVEGHPNAGSTVEIRAQISDTNLTEVRALFSKLLPDGTWTEEVPAQMTDLGSGLWGLDYEGSGSSVKIRIQAIDIADNSTESETITAKPLAEAVTLSQEYILLHRNQTTTLQAEVTPSEFADAVQWSVENSGETEVISVNELGEVTAKNVGTAYVVASVHDGEDVVTARCRVEVTAPTSLEGVQLGTTALTTELFRRDYASFDVILLLEQNQASVSDFSARETLEDQGVAVDAARFEDEAVARLFDLVVKDDRTLVVVPGEEAVSDPGNVANSYTSKVTVTVGGETFTTDSALTLTVKKTMPVLKAESLSFNSFYTNQKQSIVITGATVTGISRNEAKDTAKTTALPDWLTLAEGVLTLTDDALAKSASGSVYVLAETEEWAVPMAVTVPVKLAYKAPALKLSVSSVTFAAVNSRGVSLKLLCGSKTDTLTTLRVSGIQAPEGFEVRDFSRQDGSFTLVPSGTVLPGTENLVVSFAGTEKTVALKLKISTKPVTLSVKPGTVTLNSLVGDSAVFGVTASPADYRMATPSLRLTDSKGAAVNELDLLYSDGTVTVKTNAATKPGAAYKLYISAGGSKEAAVTIKTLAEKNSKPTLSAKVEGAIDLTFPESCAVVRPSFRNYYSGLCTLESWSVTAMKGKTDLGDVTDSFEFGYWDGQYRLLAKGDLTAGNTYLLTMIFSLDDGSTYRCSVKVPVKRTAVKLKLSATSLSLNKSVEDMAYLGLQCLTKNYDFKAPLISAPENLFVSYRDGQLFAAVNEKTEYGATYRVSVRATQYDAPVTLTVKIPAENKSTVTATLKAVGQLDVIRDSTAITVTPTYKNVLRVPNTYWRMDIYSSADNYVTPVTDLFHVEKTDSGSFVITRAEGAQINPKLKYRAVLTSKFAEVTVVSAPVALKLTAGSAKITAQVSDSALYAADKNSRVDFRLAPTGSGLNEILSVRIKNESDRNLFELFDYGSGNYAVGFRDGEVDKSLLFGKTSIRLPLEVTLDGNGTPGAATGVTLKLRYVPYSKTTGISLYAGVNDVTGKTLEMDTEGACLLTVKSQPANAPRQYVWSSSDEAVATVDPKTNVVYPHSPGKAVLTCTAADGSRVRAEVTILVTQA